MAVDIREVARRSGVSMATVSRALNGRPDVSEATRARIAQIASELGYLPNQQARALVRRRSDMVGLIWDTSYVHNLGRSPFLADLLIGLKMALVDTGYHLLLLSPKTAADGVNGFVQTAMQHSLDGVVLMGVNEHLPAVERLISSGRPCVGLDLEVSGVHASYVTTDNTAGGAAAVEHLASLGHTRIATITGPRSLITAADRLTGYLNTMADLGLEVPRGYVQTGDFFLPSGHVAMRALLSLDQPPTAVFVASDQMAIGALQAIAAAGLDVPRDLSIVGFDDVEQASMTRPRLTTVSQDYLEIGQAAVAMLRSIMDDDTRQPQPVVIPGHLVVRDSTGPVRSQA